MQKRGGEGVRGGHGGKGAESGWGGGKGWKLGCGCRKGVGRGYHRRQEGSTDGVRVGMGVGGRKRGG